MGLTGNRQGTERRLNGGREIVPAGEEMSHALGEFLAAVCGCRSLELLEVRRLGGGAVQENFAVDVRLHGGAMPGRHELVMRSDAPSRLSLCLTRPEEFAVLQAVHAAGVSVPEPLWVCDDPSLIGQAFFLMRRLPGEAAAHRVVRAERSDAEREGLVERLGEELGRLHAVRPSGGELDFLTEGDIAPAPARVAQYRRCLDELGEPQPVIEWALRWLERRAPSRGAVVLCHGDYRTGNYLVHEGRLGGILDWAFAGWGDPLEDVGWFCARCWRFGRHEREAGGLGSRAAFYRGYERASGTPIDQRSVAYWEVMATTRWAVLALGQAARHLSRRESSLELALTGRMVPELELDLLMQLDAITAGGG